ncbi:hypothetical protein ACFX13_034892 [Malus domestica]
MGGQFRIGEQEPREMDFHAMKRKQLQSLCKQHGIPANLKNTEMASRLTLLLKEDEESIEPVCKDIEENEGEIDSDLRAKKVKTVTFSPENETFYFVGTDKDSDSDCNYNPKKKQPRKRKTMTVKQVSEKNKHVEVFEDSEGLELSVDINIVEKRGRATRSRVQKSVEGGAEAVFSPLHRKKKTKTGVEKVDICDKPPLEVEVNERLDGNTENANLSHGLIRRQLRSRVVVSEDGGNLKALRKSLAPKGLKKTKENEGSHGVLLPNETSEDTVPARKGNATKVKVSSALNEEPVKIDLGGRITRSWTQVEGKSSGVESKTDSLKVQEVGQEVLQLEETFQGKNQKSLRQKSAALLKKSVDSDNNAGESIGSFQNIRRSKRNLARDGDSVCGQLIETKFVGRRKMPKMEFVGKLSGQEECKVVPQLEEPSKGPSTTSRRRFSVVQKGKELAKGDTRKRPRNTDLERASKVEQSVETIEQGVVLLPNGPLRRSRRKTTLFPSTDSDDMKLRNHEAVGTVKQSTELVAVKYSNVTKPVRRSSRNGSEKFITEAFDDKGEISGGVKNDGFVKKIQEPTLENGSSYIVNDPSSKGPQSQSSRNASKRDFVAVTEVIGIAAGNNTKTESRVTIIAEEVLSTNLNSPLEEKVEKDIDAGLYIPESAGFENDVGSSSSSKEIVQNSSKKRNESTKRRESFAKGQPSCFEVSSLYPDKDKALEILAHMKENHPSESARFQGISQVQMAQDVAINTVDSVMVDDVINDNTAAGYLDDRSCPSLNRGDTGHDNFVKQNPVDCPYKPINGGSSKFTCLGDGQSPTSKPDCEGECSKLLDLETDESLTVETINQRNDGVDEKPISKFESFSKSFEENEKPISDGEPVCTDSDGNTAEASAETIREFYQDGIVASDTAVTLPAFLLVKKAGCVDGNQFEARVTTVGESNINCIGREDFPSYANEHPDEVTSSKKVMLPCAHERANAFVREDNESFKALDFEQIVVEEYASEGIERNSKLDDGVLDKTDCQVAEDKQEVFVESNENVSGNIKEKHGHDLSGGDRTSPIALEESIMDKVGSDSKTEDTAGELVQNFSSFELPHVMSKVGDQLQDKFKLPVEGINLHERDEALVHGDQNLSFNLVGVLEEHTLQAGTKVFSNPESSMVAMIGETESGSISSSDFAKMQDVNENESEVPSSIAVSVDSEVLQSVLQLDQVTCGNPDIHKKASEVKKRRPSLASEDSMYTNDNANKDSSGVLEEHAVAASVRGCSNHESSTDSKVDERQSGSISNFDLAKMQDVNDNKSQGPSKMLLSVDSEVLKKDASLEMKRCTSFSSNDCIHMDDNTNMDGNAGILDSAVNYGSANSKTESNLDNVGDCLVGGELIHRSSWGHGIILSNDIESDRVPQIEAGLAGTNEIADTYSIRKVKLSADNYCAKPQMRSGNDSLDEGTTFQEDNAVLESKAEAGIVEKAYSDTMNCTNVDINATFRENAEGLPDFQKDNRALMHAVESEIFTRWEMNTVFGNVEQDEAKKPDEKQLANAPLTEERILEVNERCREQDTASAIIQEYIDREKAMDEYFEVKSSIDSTCKAIFTEASRTGDSVFAGLDKCRNSGVEEGACVMTSGSEGSDMAFTERMVEFYKNVPALGVCIDVANGRSNEVSETPLQLDEFNFGSVGELDKRASVASGDSISTDDETAERIANVGKMEVKSSCKECPFRTDNSEADGTEFLYGHRNGEVGSNEVDIRTVREIIGIQNVDDATKLVELMSDGGNLSEERNSLDVNSFSVISSSMDSFGPDNGPEKQGENFGMEERVSVDSPVTASHEDTDLELNVGSPLFTSLEIKEIFHGDKIDGTVKSDPEMPNVNSMIEDGSDVKKRKESDVGTAQVVAGQHDNPKRIFEEIEELKPARKKDTQCHADSPISDFSSCGDGTRDECQDLDAVLIKDNKGSEDVKEEEEKVLEIPLVFVEQRDNLGQKMGEEVPKSTYTPVSDENASVNEIPKEKDDETGSIEYSRVHRSTGKISTDSKISGINSCPFDVPAPRSDLNPDVEGTVDQEPTYASSALREGDSISADDKTAERIENFRKMDSESSSNVIHFDSQEEFNFDASGNDPERRNLPMQGDKFGIAERVSADSPAIASSHENEASKLNVAAPLFTSFEMEFFQDDNIDIILKSDPEMSNVNSMIEDHKDVKKGKESDVGTAPVAAGQHGDPVRNLEEVKELRSAQKMDSNCHADSPITDFSSCVVLGLINANEAGEDVKEKIENVQGTAQVSAEQRGDGRERMAEEVPESTLSPMSDEITFVGGLKEEGDETGDIDAKMSGISYGPFDIPAASDPNPVVDDSVDQCLASPYFVSKQDKSGSPKKECWKQDMKDSKIVSCAARLEKKESLIPSTPKSVVNTLYMKENFRSTKVDRFTKSAAETLKPRRALEDLGKK